MWTNARELAKLDGRTMAHMGTKLVLWMMRVGRDAWTGARHKKWK